MITDLQQIRDQMEVPSTFHGTDQKAIYLGVEIRLFTPFNKQTTITITL